ncbi:MAG TPA: VWA domain-containing protein [Herpetosiphonaceae bacterium]
MKQRNSILLSLIVCFMLVLTACGGAASTPAERPASSPAASSAGSPQSPSQNRTGDSKPQNNSSENSGAPQASAAASPPAALPEAAEAARPPDVAGGAPPPAESLTDSEHPPQPTEYGYPPPRRRPESPPNPGQPPYDSTFYQNYGVNPFFDAVEDPLSTFAMDIDTASYTVMRRYLSDGNLPDPDSVRVEEYLNYFNYRYPQPEDGGAFAIYTEAAPSPFGGKNYDVVQIGIQGKTIAEEDRAPTSLTFVIDVSGSMQRENRLETVKQSLSMLVEQLRPDDQIGIVVYGSDAESILEPTSGRDKQRILRAIDSLAPSGSTNVEAGLDIGFAQAEEAFIRGGTNQILLCSDGVANNGVTDPQALLQKYDRYTSQGIKLSTFGFGMGNFNDVLMEQLADAGNGFYSYIDTLEQAKRLFVDNLTGTLQLIARDAKVQVEFNPEVVSYYRLIGYENRDVADQDFRNDTVDAGEVGSGHSVTALYEIYRVPEATGDIATVRIRYHKPDNSKIIEEAQTLGSQDRLDRFDETSGRFKLAVSVAEYAELLRYSRWTRGTTLDDVVELSYEALPSFQGDQDVQEFVDLLGRAAALAD